MAEKDINVHLDLNQQEVKNAQVDNVAVSAFEGHEVFDTAAGRRHILVNATQETYAFLSDLGGLQDAFINANLVGTDLIFDQNDTTQVTIDLSSLIDDTNLPFIASGAITGTDLILTRDDASTLPAIDLSSFVSSITQTVTAGNQIATHTSGATTTPIFETVTTLTIAGNILTLTKEDGSTDDIDLSIYVDDTNLARLISGSIDGAGLATFTRDDATNFTVDFGPLFDDTNLARIVSGAVTGTDLNLTRDDASVVGPIDLSAFDQSAGVTANAAANTANAVAIAAIVDDHVTNAVLNGANEIVLTMNQGGTFTIPLAGLLDDTNLPFITGGSLTGTDLTLTRDDASTVGPISLAGLLDDTNLPFIQSGAIVGTDIVFTRDDASTFNVDVSSLVGAFGFERQTFNLSANTPLTVVAANITDIHSIQVYDSAGEMITVRVAKTANPNERILESNITEANVVVEMTGEA